MLPVKLIQEDYILDLNALAQVMGIAFKPRILIIYLNVFCMKVFTQDWIKFYSIFPWFKSWHHCCYFNICTV